MKEMSRSPIGGNANRNHSEITLHTQLGWLLLKKKSRKKNISVGENVWKQ